MILHHGYTNDYIGFRRVEKTYISSLITYNKRDINHDNVSSVVKEIVTRTYCDARENPIFYAENTSSLVDIIMRR